MIRQRFVKSRLGWHVHTTDGPGVVGEGPIFAFTQAGAERKAERLARRLVRRASRLAFDVRYDDMQRAPGRSA